MTKTADFEKSIKRLEGIVQELEKGNLSLDEALKKYEQGIEFARICSRMLKEAKARVEKLAKREGGFVTKEFQIKDEEDVS